MSKFLVYGQIVFCEVIETLTSDLQTLINSTVCLNFSHRFWKFLRHIWGIDSQELYSWPVEITPPSVTTAMEAWCSYDSHISDCVLFKDGLMGRGSNEAPLYFWRKALLHPRRKMSRKTHCTLRGLQNNRKCDLQPVILDKWFPAVQNKLDFFQEIIKSHGYKTVRIYCHFILFLIVSLGTNFRAFKNTLKHIQVRKTNQKVLNGLYTNNKWWW